MARDFHSLRDHSVVLIKHEGTISIPCLQKVIMHFSEGVCSENGHASIYFQLPILGLLQPYTYAIYTAVTYT